MGFFTKWDDSEAPEESELEQQKPSVPTPVEVTVKLTRNFIKLINNIDDIASANGWTMTVSFPEEGIDIALKSPNYCFYISNFEMDADNTDPAQIKKNLAKEVIDITRDFALGDYVYAKELAQLQKEHKTIQESDVRRYIQEGNTIRANIDGFVGGLNAVAEPEAPVKKAPPAQKKEEPEKKAGKPEIPRNTDVIDAVNKAMAQQKKAAKK